MRISDWSSDVCSSDLSTICAGADRGDSAALIRTLVSTTARSIFIGQELFQLAVGQTFGCDFFGILPQSALQSICIKLTHCMVVLRRHHDADHPVDRKSTRLNSSP